MKPQQKNKQFFQLCLLLLFPAAIFAQDVTIKGTVINASTGETLVGVNVVMDNTTLGTTTDHDGNFTLKIPAGEHTITFSFVGYETKEISDTFVSGEVKTYNISLSEGVEMDEFTVIDTKYDTGSNSTTPVAKLPTTLVDNPGVTDIGQAVDKIPGVDIIDGQANIRGGSGYSYGAGSRVMLLMNDLPVLTADAGFPNWDFLPIENMSQADVIKGASSVLYGSSAMNGIINFRTSYATSEPKAKVSLFSGIYQNPRNNKTGRYVKELDADGIVVDSTEIEKAWWGDQFPFEAGASFAYSRRFGQFDLVTGGYLFAQDSWRQTQFSRRGRLNANMRYRIKKLTGVTVGVNLNGMLNTSSSFLIWDSHNSLPEDDSLPEDGSLPDVYINSDGFYVDTEGNTYASPAYVGEEGAYRLWTATPQIINNGTKLTVDPFVEYFNPSGLSLKLLGRYYLNNNITNTNQSTLTDFFYGELQAQKRWEDIKLTITGGVAGSYTKSDAELYEGEGTINASNVGIYAQVDKMFWDRLNISLGGRWEHNTIDSESEAKPVMRTGINYQPAEYTYIRASFGQAYRFPTIAEKFVRTDLGAVDVGIPFDVGIYPNQNLKSETGWSAEIGVKQGFKISDWHGYIDVAGFINEYQDMMEFTFGVPENLLNIVQNGVPLLGIEPIWPELDTTVISIPPDVALGAGFQSVNIGDTRILGLDVSVAGQGKLFGLPTAVLMGYTHTEPKFRDFDYIDQLFSSINYEDVTDEATGEVTTVLLPENQRTNVLKYRFKNTVKVDMETTVKKMAVGVSVRWFSRMDAIDEAFNRFLPGIKEFREKHDGGTTVVDARLRYNITPQASVAIICKNLTNLEYALRPALIDAPRSFTVKYTQEFKIQPKTEEKERLIY